MRVSLDELGDAELLARSRADGDAFAVFYRRYERLVVGWLMRRTGEPELAADLAAEVFAAAYLASGRFRAGPVPAGAWMMGIARNKLRDSQRRRRIEMAARERLGIDRVTLTDAERDAAVALQEDVDAWLQALPVDQREAVRGHVVDEEDYAQLAARVNVSQATARKRVSRGLALLRQRFDQEATRP